MNDAETLAEMKRQYPYATLESHMLVDGVLHLRCGQCGIRPVPHGFAFMQWCDDCLNDPERVQAVLDRLAAR